MNNKKCITRRALILAERLRPGSTKDYSLIVTALPMPYLVPSGDGGQDMQKNVACLHGSSSNFLFFGSCNFSKQVDTTTAVLDGTDVPCAYLFAIDESITLHDLSMNCKSAEQ